MKRFFSLLLSVVLLFSMVAILPVAAEDVGCLHTDASLVNKTYIPGGVVLSEYECTCGEAWTEDEQGTIYTSVTTGCEMCRSETVWTATDGSGKTYSQETVAEKWINVPADGETKNVTSAGLCQTCFTLVWAPVQGLNNTSTNRTLSAATYNGTTGTAPAWSIDAQGIAAPKGGKIVVSTGMGTDVSSPYILSFDLNVTDIMKGNATSSTYYPLVSWVVTSSSTVAKRLLCIGATGTEASTVYLTLGDDYTFANGEANAICYLTKSEWYSIQVAVDPVSGSYWVYVNGEFVGADKNGVALTDANKTSVTKTQFEFGQGTVAGPYNFGYNIKNMDLDVTDAMGVYTDVAANELIKIGYDHSSLTGTDFDQNSGVANYLGTRNATFGNRTIVTDGKNTYGFYNTTSGQDYRFSLSTVSGSTSSDETVISPFSNKRYEIKLDFAISADNVYNSGGVNPYIIRLMKYHDNVKTGLVEYVYNNGYAYSANGSVLFAADGVTYLTPKREFVDGVPQADVENGLDATSELRVVVDEDAGTYSIYVDGKPAYFYVGKIGESEFKAFIDQPMPADWVTYLEGLGWEQNGQTFGDVSYSMLSELGAGPIGRENIRVLQNIRTFAIKELTVTLVPDSAIELVGVQEKVDETFDVRFVFGVDDIYASSVNFKVEAFYNDVYQGVQYVEINAVYNALNAGTGQLYSYECPEGNYLTAFRVFGMERTGANDIYQFVVTPFYEGQDPAAQTSYTIIYNGAGECLSNGK